MQVATLRPIQSEAIRVRGLVQGVGFRPMVWKLAHEHKLAGQVLNDGDGVKILVQGAQEQLDKFVISLRNSVPPLARIDQIERQLVDFDGQWQNFQIVSSDATVAHTGVVADAATCKECRAEINDPDNRRYGYAFTNCTHCGPRFSITFGIPYDRSNTSMAVFNQCPDCLQEYKNPADRRFHAQPNACPECGPKLWLENNLGQRLESGDVIETASEYLTQGKILAIKGIGGFHLACDATNQTVVQKLRKRKHRYQKPLAMMAQNIEQVKNNCSVSTLEEEALLSTPAPIVVLERRDEPEPGKNSAGIADAIAPGQSSLGFMLPYSPLHHLLMSKLDRPIVLTSGNRSEEPQCIDNEDAKQRLTNIADYFLLHDRDIVNRIDDSVVREMAGSVRCLRRGRGLAPQSFPLPKGFENIPEILALGGELKNTFCLLKDGQAIVSQHMGDLEDAMTLKDYQDNLTLYRELFQHQPQLLVIDGHPEYLSSKTGETASEETQTALTRIQHHHAHIASCLGDNNWSLDAGKVIGIAVDGLGFGADETFWGGEILLADYVECSRLGHFKAMPLLGGAQAMREPWRNTYAHLSSCFDWVTLAEQYQDVPIIQFLQQQPLRTFDAMKSNGINAPLATSCGRLFDAVAAAVGVCVEQQSYEGQAAIELEALVDLGVMTANKPYTFNVAENIVDPKPMWSELLEDCRKTVPASIIAARFHTGLALAICQLAEQSSKSHSIKHVALSGGVFQNKTLLELCVHTLESAGLTVLVHQEMPANDGGIAYGQALIAAAGKQAKEHERVQVCV